LFGPIVYFYFRSQVNRSFGLKRRQWLHFLPYLLYFLILFVVFIQGKETVERFQGSWLDTALAYVYKVVLMVSLSYYLFNCLRIYRAYRAWSIHQFSTDLIDFTWFRNFIYAMIFWLLFREVMNLLDAFLQLDFYQEWWWNLALVVVAIYIGLTGFGQRQPAQITFAADETKPDSVDEVQYIIARNLEHAMKKDRLYLQPELTLRELAQHLQVRAVDLSSTINQLYRQNFNQYINAYRVEAFIQKCQADQDQQYTLLSLALDSGFNSKATFNRVFKKIKGCTPKAYFAGTPAQREQV